MKYLQFHYGKIEYSKQNFWKKERNKEVEDGGVWRENGAAEKEGNK